jgi:hypothetical protein
MGGGSSDFTSMYSSHVKNRISSLRELAKDMGYMESYKTTGSLRLLADIPMILSGSFSSEFDAKIKWQDADMAFNNPSVSYETFLASGSLMAKQIGLITHGGDAYFRYEDLKSIGLDDTVGSIFEKYKNTWLSLKKTDIENSLSGSSEEDIMSYHLSEAITRLTLSDIEKYLTDFPIWKEKKDLGMSGSLHMFEVEIARENIVAMVDAFTKEATGKWLSNNVKEELQKSLWETQFWWTLGLDPNDEKRVSFDGTLQSGSGEELRIMFDGTQEHTLLSLGSSGNALNFSSTTIADGNEFVFTTVQWGEEVARLDGTIKKEWKTLRSIRMNFSAPAQWLTVTMENTYNPDGTFAGKLNAGIGNISWKWKIEPNKWLSDMHITGAMIGSSLTLDLTGATDMILRGPLLIKSGDAIITSANIGLKATSEEFMLTADVANPEDPKARSRGEISIKAKRESWNGSINPPKDSKRFQEFADALSALAPSSDSGFTEVEENSPIGPITN